MKIKKIEETKNYLKFNIEPEGFASIWSDEYPFPGFVCYGSNFEKREIKEEVLRQYPEVRQFLLINKL